MIDRIDAGCSMVTKTIIFSGSPARYGAGESGESGANNVSASTGEKPVPLLTPPREGKLG